MVSVSDPVEPESLRQAVQRIGYDLHAVTDEEPSPRRRRARRSRFQLGRLLVGGRLICPLCWCWACSGRMQTWSRLLQWALATPVVLVFGWQFHRNAALRLRSGDVSMDTLISVGTLAAYGYSVWAIARR